MRFLKTLSSVEVSTTIRSGAHKLGHPVETIQGRPLLGALFDCRQRVGGRTTRARPT
jgi:hypothetical protein